MQPISPTNAVGRASACRPSGVGLDTADAFVAGARSRGAKRGSMRSALLGAGLVSAFAAAPLFGQFPVPLSDPVAANPNAGSDIGEDYGNQVASDRNGDVWISVWRSSEDINGNIGTDFDVLFTRSFDGGVTWTDPEVLDSDAPFEDGRDRGPQLATDGAGAWIVVWYRLDDENGVPEHDLYYSVSVDNGATWSPTARLNPAAQPGAGQEIKPQVATDGKGVWVSAWHSGDPGNGSHGNDTDVFFVRSTDNGANWTPVQAVNTNSATDTGDDTTVQILTDTNGTWIVIWHSDQPSLGGTSIGADRDILYARSTDNGLTWGPVQALNTNAATDTGDDEFAHFATDEKGNWVAMWSSSDTLGGTLGNDFDILYATSSDNGATWAAPRVLNATMAGDTGADEYPQIETDASGNWVVVWRSDDTLGGTLTPKPSALISHSGDQGATWTAPAPLAEYMKTDLTAEGAYPHIDTDRKGHWVVQWRDKWTNGGAWGSDWDLPCVNFDIPIAPLDDRVLYVDATAGPGGNGLTWGTAYNDLQDALDHARRSATVEEIWIADGTYLPDRGTGDRSVSFRLVNGVDLFGGFAGGETERSQADPTLNRSTLSGNINNLSADWDNTYRVVTGVNLSRTVQIDGIVIADGMSNVDVDWDAGAGMHITSGRLLIERCTFRDNRALADDGKGGGLYIKDSELTLRDSTFQGNRVKRRGGAFYGNGSVYLVENCRFINNTSGAGQLAQNGGGAVHNFFSEPEFRNCLFDANTGYDGGAFYNHGSNTLLVDCTFVNQRARHGLAMYNYRSSPTILNGIFAHNELERPDQYGTGGAIFNRDTNLRVANSIFVDNVTGSGGGIYNVEQSGSTILNCTFADNTVYNGGASVHNTVDSGSLIVNSILWNPTGPDISEIWLSSDSRADVRYSLVRGGFAGPGVIDVDPMFADAANGDYQLLPCSPAIDAGSSTAIPGQVKTDLNGERRRKDDTGKPDTGSGPKPQPDLGAYEFQGVSSGCP